MARADAALVIMALGGAALSCEAQDLEPRAFSNTPVGMNFLIAGYGYSHGDVTFDASTPIENAELTAHGAFLAYAHAFGVWGRSAKLDLVLPYAPLSRWPRSPTTSRLSSWVPAWPSRSRPVTTIRTSSSTSEPTAGP